MKSSSMGVLELFEFFTMCVGLLKLELAKLGKKYLIILI